MLVWSSNETPSWPELLHFWDVEPFNIYIWNNLGFSELVDWFHLGWLLLSARAKVRFWQLCLYAFGPLFPRNKVCITLKREQTRTSIPMLEKINFHVLCSWVLGQDFVSWDLGLPRLTVHSKINAPASLYVYSFEFCQLIMSKR